MPNHLCNIRPIFAEWTWAIYRLCEIIDFGFKMTSDINTPCDIATECILNFWNRTFKTRGTCTRMNILTHFSCCHDFIINFYVMLCVIYILVPSPPQIWVPSGCRDVCWCRSLLCRAAGRHDNQHTRGTTGWTVLHSDMVYSRDGGSGESDHIDCWSGADCRLHH